MAYSRLDSMQLGMVSSKMVEMALVGITCNDATPRGIQASKVPAWGVGGSLFLGVLSGIVFLVFVVSLF